MSDEKVRERAESDQSQLSFFVGDEPTTIAVVSRPRNTGIDEYCDEWMPYTGEWWEAHGPLRISP